MTGNKGFGRAAALGRCPPSAYEVATDPARTTGSEGQSCRRCGRPVEGRRRNGFCSDRCRMADRRERESASAVRSPFFLTVVDSSGVKQVLRFSRISYSGARAASGARGLTAPARFSLLATRESDTLRLSVNVTDALGTEMATSGFRRVFLQMRGSFRLAGTLLGQQVTEAGTGFFETYLIPR